jgi:RHS repeat-associated protein
MANPRIALEAGDTLGSTSSVIDWATGELMEQTAMDPYGNVESDYRPARWQTFREEYKYTGKEEDLEMGLVYFGARYYHPALGRFISPDPFTIHGVAGDFNPYAYVRGRSMNATDSLGLDCDYNCQNGGGEGGGGGSGESIDLGETGEGILRGFGQAAESTAGFLAGLIHGKGSPSGPPPSPAYAAGASQRSDIAMHAGYLANYAKGFANSAVGWAMTPSHMIPMGRFGPPKDYVFGPRFAQSSDGFVRAGEEYGKTTITTLEVASIMIPVAGGVSNGLMKMEMGGQFAFQRLAVASGAEGGTGAMSIVRFIKHGERIAEIVEEGKYLTFSTGNEHALVRLESGQRAIISGGPTGISWEAGEVTRVFGHTHPYQFSPTGPSGADFEMLKSLGQRSSWLSEHGQLYRFRSGQ